MSKTIPLQHGEYYHIYNRGNNRQDIFIEERNYRHFLRLYANYIVPIADTFVYCLMRNHFHLLVRIKELALEAGEPSQAFSNLFNAYTKAINKAYSRTGALFQRPFKRIRVDSDRYFVTLVAYIHQNPQKHGFVDDFRVWPYSSYQAIVSAKPTRLNRSDVLAWFGNVEAFQEAHQREIDEYAMIPLIADDFD